MPEGVLQVVLEHLEGAVAVAHHVQAGDRDPRGDLLAHAHQPRLVVLRRCPGAGRHDAGRDDPPLAVDVPHEQLERRTRWATPSREHLPFRASITRGIGSIRKSCLPLGRLERDAAAARVARDRGAQLSAGLCRRSTPAPGGRARWRCARRRSPPRRSGSVLSSSSLDCVPALRRRSFDLRPKRGSAAWTEPLVVSARVSRSLFLERRFRFRSCRLAFAGSDELPGASGVSADAGAGVTWIVNGWLTARPLSGPPGMSIRKTFVPGT